MNKAKESWIERQCCKIAVSLSRNDSKIAYQLVKDLTTHKQGKTTTIQDKSGKCLTEDQEILKQWTEYCSELYNHKTQGDPAVINCPQAEKIYDNPILHEVEIAVKSLKKGKSAGIDNIPTELCDVSNFEHS